MGEGDKMEGEPLKGEETQNIVAEPEKAPEKVADPAPGMDRKIFSQIFFNIWSEFIFNNFNGEGGLFSFSVIEHYTK